MKRLSVFLTLFLAACGSGGGSDPASVGKVLNVYQPACPPVAIMILHQGHAPFDGGGTEVYNLVPVAEAFAEHCLVVYAMEMPAWPHEEGPIERYYQHVIDLLDTFVNLYGSLPVYMSGFSGGGWTTAVMTAMDQRIVKGYSVDGDPANEDWEQVNTPYGWPALYEMAGDRLMHINPSIGSNDPNYRFVRDPSTRQHTFSPWAVGYIITDLGL